jgi:hypothetical protein
MYAMDQTMHFEHRTDGRRPRWELRRSGGRPQPSPSPTATTTSDAEPSPTHEFLD